MECLHQIPPLNDWGSMRKRGLKDCKNHRLWIILRKNILQSQKSKWIYDFKKSVIDYTRPVQSKPDKILSERKGNRHNVSPLGRIQLINQSVWDSGNRFFSMEWHWVYQTHSREISRLGVVSHPTQINLCFIVAFFLFLF